MIQLLERVLALQERQVAAMASLERRHEGLDSELKGIHGRLAALYPALDRLYRRAGVRVPGRRRRDGGADPQDATAA